MKAALALLLLLPSVAQAQVDPRILQCSKVEEDQGRVAVGFLSYLRSNTTDSGGRWDPAFTNDIYFALVELKQFVHTNIQHIQRAGVRGEQPSVQACRNVTAAARSQIEQYARHLLRELDPQDIEGRELAKSEFRFRLEEETYRLQNR